jgi:hypothetical protein
MVKVEEGVEGFSSSFHNRTISTTIEKLKELFGEPRYLNHDVEDKVQYEWVLETTNEYTSEKFAFTVYDWKEGRELSESETIDFHIGSSSVSDSQEAKVALLDMISGTNKS